MFTQYAGAAGVANTARGPSPQLWGSCPADEITQNPTLGIHIFEDFTHFPAYVGTNAANTTSINGHKVYWGAGTSVGPGCSQSATEQGGVFVLSASDLTNISGSIQMESGAILANASVKKMWFEGRIKASTIANDTLGWFFGLLETGVLTTVIPVAADDTLSSHNLIGFHRDAGDGDMLDIKYRADGQTVQVVQADAVTLVADTYVKLGILYDTTADASQRIKFYKNGVDIGYYVTQTQCDAATFPDDVILGPVLASTAKTAAGAGTVSLDWYRYAALFA